MKKTIVFMTALLVMAVLFASCSNGMGEKADGSGSASTKAVSVNLSLGGEIANVAQKVVELSGAVDPSTFVYYYKATPNWTDSATGKTNDFVKILYPGVGNHDYEDDFSLGYFTPGEWTFEVEVRIPATPSGETVLYEGKNENVAISNTQKDLTIAMSLKDEDESGDPLYGTINIAVAVPYISNNTVVAMKLDGQTIQSVTKTDGKTVTSTTDPTPANAPGWELFTKEITNAEPGLHTILLEYKDGDNSVGGAAVAFTVVNAGNYLVCGTIENGQYQIVALTLEGIDAVNLSLTPGTTSIGQDGTLVYTATDSWSATHEGTYTWYVNGVATANNRANKWEFAVDTTVPGVYEITCKVEKDYAVGSKSITLTVDPADTHVNIVTKIDGTGKNIKTAAVGDTIVCTPVNLPQSGSVAWYVNGTLQEAGVDDQTKVFTFDETTSTTHTTPAGTYKIVCKVTNAGELIGYGEKTITIE